MNALELERELHKIAEPALEVYQKRVITDTNYQMLFVRMPNLRHLANKASKGDWQKLVNRCTYVYFEEVLCVALAVAYAKAPLEERLSVLWEDLIYRLDSWAMTDAIVPTFRVKDTERTVAWEFVLKCLDGKREYTRRFGIVMMLTYFLTEDYIPLVEEKISQLQDQRYYVRMASAWLLAEMSVRDFQRVLCLLKKGVLDPVVQNMTIRKIRESNQIRADKKAEVAALKRKFLIE